MTDIRYMMNTQDGKPYRVTGGHPDAQSVHTFSPITDTDVACINKAFETIAAVREIFPRDTFIINHPIYSALLEFDWAVHRMLG